MDFELPCSQLLLIATNCSRLLLIAPRPKQKKHQNWACSDAYFMSSGLK